LALALAGSIDVPSLNAVVLMCNVHFNFILTGMVETHKMSKRKRKLLWLKSNVYLPYCLLL